MKQKKTHHDKHVNNQSTRSIKVKKSYSFVHKRRAKITKKGNKMLMESIDWINDTNLLLENNQVQS
jgi:hypothetical protein